MPNSPTPKEFGHYAPKRSLATALLTLIRHSGASRGIIRRAVTRRWHKLGYKTVDVTLNGIKWRLMHAHNTTDGKILSTSKTYDGAELDALHQSLTHPEAAFIDIGANTGYYSLTLAKRGCQKILAIEPNPPTLEALRFNIKINGWEDRIAIIPMCVGDPGKTPLYYSGDMGGASVVGQNTQIKPTMVDSMPLLDIIRQANIHTIGGMKLDIEGYEDRALFPFFAQAPLALYPKTIVIEICNKTLWQQNIIAKMQQLGYTPTRDKLRGNLILHHRPTAQNP